MVEDVQKLEAMWSFIEKVLSPYGLVPQRKDMKYEDVVQLYSELVAVDIMFRELEQIVILKRELDLV